MGSVQSLYLHMHINGFLCYPCNFTQQFNSRYVIKGLHSLRSQS